MNRSHWERLVVPLSVLVLVPVLAAAQEPPGNDLPNKAGWNVEPDPGATFKGPFDLTGGIPVGFGGKVVFPSTPSAYVAVTPPKTKNVYQAYDLRTMKPVGKAVTIADRLHFNNEPAVAPDGKHLAIRVKQGAGGVIEVWSVETGASVLKLPPEQNPDIKPKYYDLLGKNRLWVGKHKSEFPLFTAMTMFQVHDIATGKEISRYKNPLVPIAKWHTFSAGSRYQFMEQTGGWFLFLVWDTNTGKLVGEREFQNKKALFGQAAGLAFSPDGEEMAMLWRINQKPNNWGRLLVFETRTGKRLYDHPIAYVLPMIESLWSEGGTRCLQWWPQRQGWLLFGHLLIDRESGAVVHKIGPAPAFGGALQDRRFLDGEHITSVEGKFERQLKIVQLPRGEIDAAIKKARQK